MDLSRRARSTYFGTGGGYVVRDPGKVLGLVFGLVFFVLFVVGSAWFVLKGGLPNGLQIEHPSDDRAILLNTIYFGSLGLFSLGALGFLLTGMLFAAAFWLIIVALQSSLLLNYYRFPHFLNSKYILVGAFVTYLVIPLIVFIYLLLRIKVVAGGYIFDFDKGEMSFPGGNISANSMWDYFKPWFSLQRMMRFTIRYEEIRNMRKGTSTGDVPGSVEFLKRSALPTLSR